MILVIGAICTVLVTLFAIGQIYNLFDDILKVCDGLAALLCRRTRLEGSLFEGLLGIGIFFLSVTILGTLLAFAILCKLGV